MPRLFASLIIATAILAGSAFATTAYAGGGGHGGCTERPQEGTDASIRISSSCYRTAFLYVEQGTTVTWTNDDEAQHNVTFLDASQAGGDGFLNRGDSVTHAFTVAGLYPYFCSIHPWMLGAVSVGDPANFVVSSETESPVAEVAPVTAGTSSNSNLTPALGGLILSVGLVSAGGGYLLRRRKS
jgi:plastocyanin